MSNPAYISNVDVFSNNSLLPIAVLLSSSSWAIRYDTLDLQGQTDLATLVTANGGSLPLSSVSIAQSTILANGKSWYDTYVASTFTIPSATSDVAGTNQDHVYYDTSTSTWRYKYNNSAA